MKKEYFSYVKNNTRIVVVSCQSSFPFISKIIVNEDASFVNNVHIYFSQPEIQVSSSIFILVSTKTNML